MYVCYCKNLMVHKSQIKIIRTKIDLVVIGGNIILEYYAEILLLGLFTTA